MQTFKKDWDSNNANIYTDGEATHSNASSGSSIIVTTDPQSYPIVHRLCTIPASKWCSPFKAKQKPVRTALKLVQEDVSLHKMHIVSDRMSTLQQIQSLHPSQQVANSNGNVILDTLASITKRGCHLAFTWCPSHSGVCSKELADMAAKGGQLWSRKAKIIITIQRKRQYGRRRWNPLLPTSVHIAKDEKKLSTSWKAYSCQGRNKSPSAI